MGIITISRGSYTRGKEIAQKLGEKLGYKCISRELLLKDSKDFNVAEVKLLQATHDSPSIFDNIKDGKRKYTAFIREAFLEYIQTDNVVYDGFAGHYFTREIPNILKVRIIANLDYRINVVMERENISEEKARKLIYNLDVERRKWSMYLYGIDTNATELYDLVLQIDNLSATEAKEKLKEMFESARAYSSSSAQTE
jgi:cytidylate kinase